MNFFSKSYLVILSLSFLFLYASCVTKMPIEKGEFYSTNLVELVKLDSTILLDIRYATSNNFVGQPVYKEARAFLQKDPAVALQRINASLKPLGYGLLVFDGYRRLQTMKCY
jgi:zinc D-Ala-D-Ala dipeptidase